MIGRFSRHRGIGWFWVRILICVLSMPLCVKMLPGFSADPFESAVWAGVALGLCYALLRPLVYKLTLPLGCLTLGLFGFMTDCALIYLLSRVVPGFSVENPLYAALAAILVNGLLLITRLL